MIEENTRFAPIGIFDSGYGGLTVLREIRASMPAEDIIFVGDSARCPYGPRNLDEVRGFVMQICSYLEERGCKLIVIACNTATAAGLKDAQRSFSIPIVGVVEPGSRAAVHMTCNRRVGVIATEGTVRSCAYETAIHSIDAGIEIYSVAAPEFVRIAEQGLHFDSASDPSVWDEHRRVAQAYLSPLREKGIDTLVLGCTHFPLIQPLIAEAIGEGVRLVSSAEETDREVYTILRRRGWLADEGKCGVLELATTAVAVDEFKRFGSVVLSSTDLDVHSIALPPYRGR